jgi:hypothetical protein
MYRRTGDRRTVGCSTVRRIAIGLVGVALTACGGEESALPAPDSSGLGPQTPEALFDPGRLLEIEIEMGSGDWDLLREEGYSLFEFQRGEAGDYPYTYFSGSISVDGHRLDDVAIRKKGGLGSLSRHRPSLKVNFRGNGVEQRLAGVTRLTLNNDRTDPSHSRQCMAYALFERAGLPAPRCNLAHVTVNGVDMGTFTNVEPIKKPLLERLFGDGSGNLYEGRENADFTAEALEDLEIKNNEDTNDRSDLRAVAQALESSDADVVEALGQVLDMDRFRRFWAMETLTGNWDSYSGNINNFYAYHDPISDRFVFIPWGADTAFTGGSVIDSFNQTLTVYATSAITNRLYNIAEERERHRQLMGELVAELWDEAGLLSELHALSDLSTDALVGAVVEREEYLSTYAGRLGEELAAPAPEWRLGGIDLSDACRGGGGTFNAEFSTTWTNGPVMPDPDSSTFTASFVIEGETVQADWIGGAGRDPEGAGREANVLHVGLTPDGGQLIVPILMSPQTVALGVQPFYNFENVGFVFQVNPRLGFRGLGVLSDGEVTFDEVGTNPGDRVRGSVSAQFFQSNCL